jgi:hypothetical protein
MATALVLVPHGLHLGFERFWPAARGETDDVLTLDSATTSNEHDGEMCRHVYRRAVLAILDMHAHVTARGHAEPESSEQGSRRIRTESVGA